MQQHSPTASASPLEKELINAKQYLQEISPITGDSLYEHLSHVISKLIMERPANVVDYFESYSLNVRSGRYRQCNRDYFEEVFEDRNQLSVASMLLPSTLEIAEEKNLRKIPIDELGDKDSIDEDKNEVDVDGVRRSLDVDAKSVVDNVELTNHQDLFELHFHWNFLGIAFTREETFLLSCSMKKFKMNVNVKTFRFWGKIFGLKNDYYVVECTLTEEALKHRNVSISV
jgi:radial spoke head protein 4A